MANEYIFPILYIKYSNALKKATRAIYVSSPGEWTSYDLYNSTKKNSSTALDKNWYDDPAMGRQQFPISTRNILMEEINVVTRAPKSFLDEVIKEINSITESDIDDVYNNPSKYAVNDER